MSASPRGINQHQSDSIQSLFTNHKMLCEILQFSFLLCLYVEFVFKPTRIFKVQLLIFKLLFFMYLHFLFSVLKIIRQQKQQQQQLPHHHHLLQKQQHHLLLQLIQHQ